MTFEPRLDALIPELTPQEELVLLARSLWREGYNDHLAGHITISRGDGTLWCNPWMLTWDELRPRDVLVIDLEGNVLEGDWPAPLGIPLHLELHRARPDVQVAMHSHPLYGVIWADLCEIPPILDQSSALGGGGDLVLVDEFDGTVDDSSSAAATVRKMDGAEHALLAGHGVFVLGSTVRAVHQRAVALEQRCHRAWLARAISTKPLETVLPKTFLDAAAKFDSNGFQGFWEAAVRKELREDPALLPHSSRTPPEVEVCRLVIANLRLSLRNPKGGGGRAAPNNYGWRTSGATRQVQPHLAPIEV